MRPNCCRRKGVVCLSVCHTGVPCKTAEPIVWTRAVQGTMYQMVRGAHRRHLTNKMDQFFFRRRRCGLNSNYFYHLSFFKTELLTLQCRPTGVWETILMFFWSVCVGFVNYPRDAMLARLLALCICLSQVGVLAKRLNKSSWVLA